MDSMAIKFQTTPLSVTKNVLIVETLNFLPWRILLFSMHSKHLKIFLNFYNLLNCILFKLMFSYVHTTNSSILFYDRHVGIELYSYIIICYVLQLVQSTELRK